MVKIDEVVEKALDIQDKIDDFEKKYGGIMKEKTLYSGILAELKQIIELKDQVDVQLKINELNDYLEDLEYEIEVFEREINMRKLEFRTNLLKIKNMIGGIVKIGRDI